MRRGGSQNRLKRRATQRGSRERHKDDYILIRYILIRGPGHPRALIGPHGFEVNLVAEDLLSHVPA
jgi:hypothetical protein